MNEFERRFQLRTLSEQLMFIAVAKGVLVEHITEYADREVDGTPSCKNSDNESIPHDWFLQHTIHYFEAILYLRRRWNLQWLFTGGRF